MAFNRYGRRWEDTDGVLVELWAYREARRKTDFEIDHPGQPVPADILSAVEGLDSPEEHLLRAITEAISEKHFRVSSWTRRRVAAFVRHRWHTQLGAAGCGKSTDMAAIVYFDYLAYREHTTVKIYSTTKDALKRRIWKDLVKFHQLYPADLRYTPSTMQITYGVGDTINGIFGQGVLRDSGELAVSNLIGVHNTRNICVADELQGTPEEVIKQTANQRVGGLFIFVGLGNPLDLQDTLCKHSVPWGGWKSINLELAEEWVTRVGVKKKGFALRFDGLKSPRIVEENGEALYPFLIGLADIQSIEDQFGPESQEFWAMARGIPRAGSGANVCIDPDLVGQMELQGKFVFVGPTEVWAGFDPAFTSGGDRPFLSFCRVGTVVGGFVGIQFFEDVVLRLNRTEGETMTQLICRLVVAECRRRGVPGRRFAMDTTGQDTLADVLSEPRHLGPGIHRESFGRVPTEDRVSSADKRTGKEAYRNRVTQLWFQVAKYAETGQLRGLSDDAVTEFTHRKFLVHPSGKRELEPKVDYKARQGSSPDNADSKAIVVGAIRAKKGVVPGQRATKQLTTKEALDRRAILRRIVDGRKKSHAPFSEFRLKVRHG